MDESSPTVTRFGGREKDDFRRKRKEANWERTGSAKKNLLSLRLGMGDFTTGIMFPGETILY